MALTNIPDPRLIDWMTWLDTLIAYNTRASRLMEIGTSVDDRDTGWRDIADRLALLEPNTPRHESFSDWREWAFNVIAVNRS